MLITISVTFLPSLLAFASGFWKRMSKATDADDKHKVMTLSQMDLWTMPAKHGVFIILD